MLIVCNLHCDICNNKFHENKQNQYVCDKHIPEELQFRMNLYTCGVHSDFEKLFQENFWDLLA